MDDELVNPAAVIFIMFMIAAFLVWLCLPPLVWNFTEEEDVWYIDDYKLNRNECIEVFRSNNLCFRVREEDLIRDHHTNDALASTSTSRISATGQNIQVDCLHHDVEDHADIDIETGGKSMLCINIVEAIIDEDKNPNHDIIETSGVNVDHDRCDIDNDDGEDDNATIDSDNNGLVLRIPNRAKPLTTRLNNRDTVSIVCTICLENYKVNDELAFSSNNECSHVFHLDCVTEYIGKTKGAEKPCPCCRRWFLNVPMFICNEDNDGGGEMPMCICTEDEDDGGGDKIKRKEEKRSTANELFLAL